MLNIFCENWITLSDKAEIVTIYFLKRPFLISFDVVHIFGLMVKFFDNFYVTSSVGWSVSLSISQDKKLYRDRSICLSVKLVCPRLAAVLPFWSIDVVLSLATSDPYRKMELTSDNQPIFKIHKCLLFLFLLLLLL